jgi:iron complex transport system ATP-binding protein
MMAAVSDALVLENVSIGYGRGPDRLVIASGLNAHLPRGCLTCLLGPNGAGKSTLMRTIAGMQPLLGGEVRIAGGRLDTLAPREIARRLSVVLTDRVDAWMLSAYALVSLGRHPHTDWTGHLTSHDHQRVREALSAVGAEDLASRPVTELSDGERQKVMLARALAQDAPLLLLDEITAFLDLPRRVDIMRTLGRLAHESGYALLLSTHDLDLALRTADSVWLLSKDGTLRVGIPEELVLNGAFQSTFASEGITFDARVGAFRVQRAHQGTARLIGNGIRATWTARALERIGYEIVDNGAATLRVEVGDDVHGSIGWSLDVAGRTTHVTSLSDALAWLTTQA